MISLHPGAGILPLLHYLRGHAEAVAQEGAQNPALGAELLERCFGAAGRGFKYKKDRRRRDDWYGFGPAVRELVCDDWQVTIAGRVTGPVCVDCEDQLAYYTGAAILTGAYEWVEVGIIPPPSEGADGHAIGRVGPRVAPGPPGLHLPPPGIWDPSAWTGMPTPPLELYETAVFLRMRQG